MVFESCDLGVAGEPRMALLYSNIGKVGLQSSLLRKKDAFKDVLVFAQSVPASKL